MSWPPQQTTARRVETPHEAPSPADTETNDPDGVSDCGETSPQHSAAPPVRNPHECQVPADTEVNEPVGGVACPLRLLPQQATVRSVLTPHEWA